MTTPIEAALLAHVNEVRREHGMMPLPDFAAVGTKDMVIMKARTRAAILAFLDAAAKDEALCEVIWAEAHSEWAVSWATDIDAGRAAINALRKIVEDQR